MNLKDKIKKTSLYELIMVIKNTRVFNFFPRLRTATKYYNKKYIKIFSWLITSRETTNFTYTLTHNNLRYLKLSIAHVCKVDPQQIEKYIYEIINNKELKIFLKHRIDQIKTKGITDKECHFGKRIGWYVFARQIKPKIIIETGIDKGLGSVVLCYALKKNKQEGFEGRYYGTEINPTAGQLFAGEYKQYGEILYGDSIESLSKVNQSIDLFINDSDHSAEYEYREYQTIKNKLSDKAIILGDNSHVTNKLAVFSEENNRNFLFFHEEPKNHWYPGGGIGISFKNN